MGTKTHYPEELKFKAVELVLSGMSSEKVAEKVGVKRSSQVRTWMMWYRNDKTHRFKQPVGKQYTYNKGIGELSEVEQLKLRIRQLEMHNDILQKLNGILRK